MRSSRPSDFDPSSLARSPARSPALNAVLCHDSSVDELGSPIVQAREALTDQTSALTDRTSAVDEVVSSDRGAPPPCPQCARTWRRHTLHPLSQTKSYRKRNTSRPSHHFTDTRYTECLCLRTVPVSTFLSDRPRRWALPITSCNEDRLLSELGLLRTVRNQIEGLRTVQSRRLSLTNMEGGALLTEEQLSSRAAFQLAVNPPAEVGSMQRRTARWLLRP
jgi:hypothetical protein